ncbi:helix-turn-helix domain-containing protein [uncultured Tateyamaria sp.]|uniref:GlxA family transcriptional regulator n=1 Tax=uncultured Tateyamaria sp. TaxID=455651 RepID=UPI0026035A17|nr:helix-turn-helix domain-containing protein [uncultured Tateyamaria sp.]
MTKTVVLVLQDTNTLSLAAAIDPLRAANRQAGHTVFDWQLATPGTQDVMLTSGLRVTAAPLHRVPACDVLIVVAGFALEAQATPHLMASLRRLAKPDTTVLAIDGGPWVVAKSGLLNGRKATTHWEDLEKFATTFAEVETINARYVVSDQRWTSGGAAPALDMMLHLIQVKAGARCAAQVAASFIHTSRPAPSDPQMRHPPTRPHTPITARAHRLMEAHLEHPLPLPAIAAQLGLTPRSLQLHFRRALNITAKAHYLTLRLTEAHRLLCIGADTVQQVALATGFTSSSTFSRAYRAQFGEQPRETRLAPRLQR